MRGSARGDQPDDAQDQSAHDEIAADAGLSVAAEEYPVRKNDRALARALERSDEMEEEGVVAVLRGRDPVLEAAALVVVWIEAVRPRLGRERGIWRRRS